MKDKKLRNDLILIVSLLLVAVVSLILVLSSRQKSNLIAKVTVQNEVVEVIDLSKKEDKDYVIHGLKGDLVVHTHDGAIAITQSSCPHQDCVNMGYVNDTNHPIICAYNAVTVVIDGESDVDVELGR